MDIQNLFADRIGGSSFGTADSGSYLRFSATFSAEEQSDEQIIAELERRLRALELVF